MAAVSVTSKGQVTISKKVRQALGITAGSKVEFNIEGGDARVKLVRKRVPSHVEDGPKILRYKGPIVQIEDMDPARLLARRRK